VEEPSVRLDLLGARLVPRDPRDRRPRGAQAVDCVYPRKVHIEIGPPILPPKAEEGKRLPRTAYKDQTELLHAEIQRLFDRAMERVPWSYPID
jgi:hypothetical protein